MSDQDLTAVEDWAAALLAKLQAPERRRINRAVALELRRHASQRIAAQQAPDGTPFTPRKNTRKNLRGKQGQVKRKMFTRLRAARYLKVNATDTEAAVGFSGRTAQIAVIHHEGRPDRPAPGQRAVSTPRRRLLGFTAATRQRVFDLLVQHLANRGL